MTSVLARPLTVVGLGESLFDVFPDLVLLGGAPLNVAVQSHQLLSPVGGRGVVVSRVGGDELADRMRRELAGRGMALDWLQADPQRLTGQAIVEIQHGEPHFDIVANVAWDHLECREPERALARQCHAVCFGTLGQRNPAARAAIEEFVSHAPQAVRLFDVNLRQQYYTAEIIRRGCELASVVKLNERELRLVADLLQLPGTNAPSQMASLVGRYQLQGAVLTRGAAGTAWFDASGCTELPPVQYPAAPNADAVGAGDACSAGTLADLLLGMDATRTVALANRMGAYVASQPGATPALPEELLHEAMRSP